MPSLIPGYEYDVFISYRHNDNRSGWVTEFVKHLNEELAATIKEPLSVYFDSNPTDGILETHNVGKSLEGRLKCLIFIPILSQTYCDPTSFAWKREFCVFNSQSGGEALGRDIKLSNGNVASRILPVKIHDLDGDDRAAIEKETDGVLRAIEFIYKEPGVNRSLRPTDNKSDNQNKTDYKNQVNKVAYAVKEILSGMKGQPRVSQSNVQIKFARPVRSARKVVAVASLALLLIALASYFLYSKILSTVGPETSRKSIAVLPFRNDSEDHTNIYFCNGLMEDIISELSKIKDLRVPSATSMIYYQANPKPYPEIVNELKVNYLLEGSVRKMANKAIMTVNLIDAELNTQLWSKRYEMDLSVNDILNTQFQVASNVTNTLKLTLTSKAADVPTNNFEAYDYFLRGRDLARKWNRESNREAMSLLKKSIALDPQFSTAYAILAITYGQMFEMSDRWYADLEVVDSIRILAEKSLSIKGETAEGFNALAYHYGNNYDYQNALTYYLKAYAVDPSTTENYASWCYMGAGDVKKSFDWSTRQIESDPLNAIHYVDLTSCLVSAGLYDEAEMALKRSIKLSPDMEWGYETLVEIKAARGEYDEAIRATDAALAQNFKSYNVMSKILLLLTKGNLVKVSQIIDSTESNGVRGYKIMSKIIRSYIMKTKGKQEEPGMMIAEVLEEIKQRPFQNPGVTDIMMALSYAIIDDRPQSLRAIKALADRKDPHVRFLFQNPILKEVKLGPEFKKLENDFSRAQEDDRNYMLPRLKTLKLF